MSAVLFIDGAYYLAPENKMEMILERKKKWKITEKNCLLFLQATRKKWNAIQAESRTEERVNMNIHCFLQEIQVTEK